MITVTSPLLPPLEEFIPYLQDIWERRYITNNGHYHREPEAALCEYLGVEHLSLFTNGTLPLLTAFQALEIKGEVITTPYSFVATTHALRWNGITPVFVDIDPETGNLDPAKIEAAITPRTAAILPVHVYGKPCRTAEIQDVASKHGLKVIYDAAHAFGVTVGGESILQHGDMATLSFHATKTYNTVEGGALICRSAEMKRRIDELKNFGFQSEVKVGEAGINGKMDEIRAAYGLLALKYVNGAIEARRAVAQRYREALRPVRGLTFFDDMPGVRHNYSYFPIFIDAPAYGESRDALYERLKAHDVYARRYFYPLISSFEQYSSLPSAGRENLPQAYAMADQVLCLPMHHELSDEDVEKVIKLVVR